jgi:hypothetical protein
MAGARAEIPAWENFQADLSDQLNLLFDLSQGGFKCGAAAWIRGSLRKNVLALQVERLFLSFVYSTLLFGRAPILFTHIAVAAASASIRQGICHLLLHRFTFPTTGHIFILRGF